MISQKNIYQHFHPEEAPFIEKMMDQLRRVEDNYLLHVTDFLNPRQIEIVKILSASMNITCFSSSDHYHTEYGRVILAPDYYQLDPLDYDISLVEISYHSKFNTLTHAQILGTLINELGIKRSMIGDILVHDGFAQLMVNRQFLHYFWGNIQKIARVSVNLKEIDLNSLLLVQKEESLIDITLSSLRIDRLIASVLKLSRSQAIKLVESEKVKVNYRIITKSSDSIAIGDLVSVRGFGRFKLLQDNGFTKNGKYKITLSKTLHK